MGCAQMKTSQRILLELEKGPATRKELERIFNRELRNILWHMLEDGLIKVHSYRPSEIKGRMTIYTIGKQERKPSNRQKKEVDVWITKWSPFRDPMYTAIFGRTQKD